MSGTPVTFARNRLEIVVKPGNPLGIHSLADLTKASVVVHLRADRTVRFHRPGGTDEGRGDAGDVQGVAGRQRGCHAGPGDDR